MGHSQLYSVPVVVSEDGLVYIGSFAEQLESVQEFINSKGAFLWKEDLKKTKQAIDELEAYLSGGSQSFSCTIDFLWGTNFQQQVWKCLLTIPFGKASSYSEVAQALGRPQAVRAVGSAIGRNPLSIVVPCHRVLTKAGRLGGYSGGLDMKKTLLALEGISYKL